MPFKPLHIPSHLYFVTNVIIDKLPIFNNPSFANIILSSLDWHRKEKRIQLFAFTIMPSHLHWMCQPNDPFTVNEVLQSFASLTAHEILKQLRKSKLTDWIDIFSARAKDDKQHRIWQETLAENIFSINFLKEKMEYIHNNPISKHWHLVVDRADYRYSSACFYDRDEVPVIEVDDVRGLLA